MLNIRICVGTYCYITGGSELIKLKEHLPQEIKDKVQIIGAACLGCDEGENKANPPYAKVGDVLICKCTPETLLEEIYAQLGIVKNE